MIDIFINVMEINSINNTIYTKNSRNNKSFGGIYPNYTGYGVNYNMGIYNEKENIFAPTTYIPYGSMPIPNKYKGFNDTPIKKSHFDLITAGIFTTLISVLALLFSLWKK